jgi:hypothetical protein
METILVLFVFLPTNLKILGDFFAIILIVEEHNLKNFTQPV